MPEQSPDGGHDLVTALVRDESTNLTPPDAATLMFAAVESDAGRSKKKGIGVGGWLCGRLARVPAHRRDRGLRHRSEHPGPPRPQERRRRLQARHVLLRPPPGYRQQRPGHPLADRERHERVARNRRLLGAHRVPGRWPVRGALRILQGPHRRRARCEYRHPACLPTAGPRDLDRHVPGELGGLGHDRAGHRVDPASSLASRVPPRSPGPSASS